MFETSIAFWWFSSKTRNDIEYKFLIEIFLLEVMLFNISLNISPLLLILYMCTCSKRVAFEYGKVFDICIFHFEKINLRGESEFKSLYRASIRDGFHLWCHVSPELKSKTKFSYNRCKTASKLTADKIRQCNFWDKRIDNYKNKILI